MIQMLLLRTKIFRRSVLLYTSSHLFLLNVFSVGECWSAGWPLVILLRLQGVLTRDFRFQAFSWISFSRAPEYPNCVCVSCRYQRHRFFLSPAINYCRCRWHLDYDLSQILIDSMTPAICLRPVTASGSLLFIKNLEKIRKNYRQSS